MDESSYADVGFARLVVPTPKFGLASSTLHDLADLVLHYSWLSLFNKKAARSNEDTEF